MKKKIFITGGAGYVGSWLVPYLLEKNYEVTVYDTMYFTDNFLPKRNKNLKIIKGDIRDTDLIFKSCKGNDFFLHLACISNDVSFELDEKLSTSINLHAFEPMVKAAKKAKIKRFIYASTSSVYGLSDKKEVKEDHPLVPITLYNKYKGECEPILLSYTDNDFEGVIFRPATVCGYAPRLRLDLSVNILTNYAVNKGFIKVYGGKQLRPNIHIKDYCEAVWLMITAESKKIKNQIFNLGYQNLSILEIANIVKKVVERKIDLKKKIEILIEPSKDIRSYHINSEKIKNILDFKPKHTIENAIEDLCNKFKYKLIPNSFSDDIYFNIERMKNLSVK